MKKTLRIITDMLRRKRGDGEQWHRELLQWGDMDLSLKEKMRISSHQHLITAEVLAQNGCSTKAEYLSRYGLESVTLEEVENGVDLPLFNADAVDEDLGRAPYDYELDDDDNETLCIWTVYDATQNPKGRLHLVGSNADRTATPAKTNGKANAEVLRALPLTCVGIHLEKMYPLYYTYGTNSEVNITWEALYTPKNGDKNYWANWAKSKFINLQRDFIIDGEVDGQAVGGFFCWQYAMFYTEHSLWLRKAHFQVPTTEPYISFLIDCRQGVDQFVVEGCLIDPWKSGKETTRDTNGVNRFINLYFEDRKPTGDDGEPLDDGLNLLRHFYVRGNEYYGNGMASSQNAMITQSFRIVGNTVHMRDKVGCAFDFGAYNNLSYEGSMSYRSCPIWFVGNVLDGDGKVACRRSDGYLYYSGALFEARCAFSIGNEMRNYIGKTCVYSEKTVTRTPGGDVSIKVENFGSTYATYDVYGSCNKYYCVNNRIHNVLSITPIRNDERSGVFKSKGGALPMSYFRGKRYTPNERYFSGNVVTLDSAEMMSKWLAVIADRSNASSSRKYYSDNVLSPETTTIDSQGNTITKSKYWDSAAEMAFEDTFSGDVDGMGHLTVTDKVYEAMSIGLDSILAYGRQEANFRQCALLRYTFINNEIDLGDCALGGIVHNADGLPAVRFHCEGNVFKAGVMPSNNYSPHLIDINESNSKIMYDTATNKNVFVFNVKTNNKNNYDLVPVVSGGSVVNASTTDIRNDYFCIEQRTGAYMDVLVPATDTNSNSVTLRLHWENSSSSVRNTYVVSGSKKTQVKIGTGSAAGNKTGEVYRKSDNQLLYTITNNATVTDVSGNPVPVYQYADGEDNVIVIRDNTFMMKEYVDGNGVAQDSAVKFVSVRYNDVVPNPVGAAKSTMCANRKTRSAFPESENIDVEGNSITQTAREEGAQATSNVTLYYQKRNNGVSSSWNVEG